MISWRNGNAYIVAILRASNTRVVRRTVKDIAEDKRREQKQQTQTIHILPKTNGLRFKFGDSLFGLAHLNISFFPPMEQTDETYSPPRKRDALSSYFLGDDSEDEDEDDDDDWEASQTIDAIDDTNTVFICGEYAASKRSDLEKHGITHVLTIAEESEFKMKKVMKIGQSYISVFQTQKNIRHG